MHPSALNWQAVFFDFDGVIAASTEVKVRAFATLFAPYGQEVQQAVIRYHLVNGGMPRHQKLRYCFETLAGTSIDEAFLRQAGERFSCLVFDEVVAAPLMPGVQETLTRLREAAIPAFVVSGTPLEELQRIVERKGLSPFFLEVHGSPLPKPDIVTGILSRYSYRPDLCLFIGDAIADLRAAQVTGLRFLGIAPEGQPSIFPQDTSISPTVTLAV